MRGAQRSRGDGREPKEDGRLHVAEFMEPSVLTLRCRFQYQTQRREFFSYPGGRPPSATRVRYNNTVSATPIGICWTSWLSIVALPTLLSLRDLMETQRGFLCASPSDPANTEEMHEIQKIQKMRIHRDVPPTVQSFWAQLLQRLLSEASSERELGRLKKS